MAEQTPERSAYLPPHARSQQSNNWRVKDDSPRVEQNSHFRQDRNNSNTGENSSSVDSGSRLWVGNLLYTASREDVEQLFTANGFPPTGLSMSVDPFTQRNPSYCFLDFETAEDAARAMEAMNGKELLGREIKVNPGVRRQQGDGERRTRDFSQTGGTGGSRFTRDYPQNGTQSSPAYNRWNRTDQSQYNQNAQSQGFRLYVGGLPRIEPQAACESTIRQLFTESGFDVAAISKLISPHPDKAEEPGNHHYIFVDMNSLQDVEAAVERMNGIETEWGALRVGQAKQNRDRERRPNQNYERRLVEENY
ncbi:uncharacterized protein AB675_1275 [Cyphellophora attinorum]|uniref:RRM domain-containing protein n=1 Tax=Cyphellophora attinorum TaxID=1664694 RepID=A0A0N1NY99_9EURO|nr:uncharacterized protein AB675_1275 [Phialophora attinorum]KPI35694.1 hypothetical protein AB675_1275 [Phialophora attinorum]